MEMGFLRLFLAALVLASHNKIMPFVGTLAVELFFVLSGFYIQMIITEHYAGQKNWTYKFYTSRLLRLYVPYWVILACILTAAPFVLYPIYIDSLPSASINVFILGSEHLKLLRITSDTTMLALWEGIVIKPVWSIGMELIFYGFAPLLLTRLRLSLLVFITSTSLMVKAWFLYYHLDIIPTLPAWDGMLNNIFPFELGFFTLGALLYRFYKYKLIRCDQNKNLSIVLYYGLVGSLLLSVYALLYIFIQPDRAMVEGYYAYLAGIVCIIPFLFAVSRRRKLDRMLGDLSYPFYLLNYHVAQSVSLRVTDYNHTFVYAFLITIALSWLVVKCVETPLTTLRHRLFRAK
jgi:peptidoglycan/LPS O-acetylase OafA/YrhL